MTAHTSYKTKENEWLNGKKWHHRQRLHIKNKVTRTTLDSQMMKGWKRLPPIIIKWGEGRTVGRGIKLTIQVQECFCAAIITCIYSPVMTMFTHREKRQKHRDKTASSAIHELPDRQTGGQTDKLSRDERELLWASVLKRIFMRLIGWLVD